MLEAHPAVEKVLYPGLASHPQHAVAAKQMRGFGGMITFYVKGGLAGARAFLENVKVSWKHGLRDRGTDRGTAPSWRDRGSGMEAEKCLAVCSPP